MTPAKPAVGLAERQAMQGTSTVRYRARMEWEWGFGAAALLLGLLLLLTDLPLLLLSTGAAALFVLGGAFCAVRHQQMVGVAAFGLGLVLLLPLSGIEAAALTAYRILVGAALGFFGILKLT